MKLAKIKNIREGQIYKDKNNLYLIIDIICGNITYQKYNTYDLKGILKEKRTDCDFLFFKDKERELIGFVDITHKMEDGKLVEIPREIYNIDDVLKINSLQVNNTILEEEQVVVGVMFDCLMNCYEISTIYTTNDIIRANLIKTIQTNIEKIGILGVNYEFINNKLVKEND